ncbi:hypothetical protein pb186bvf_017695 [Paramecium bursaria]
MCHNVFYNLLLLKGIIKSQFMDQQNFLDLQGDLKQFYDNHGVQLLGMQFPISVQLLEMLEKKLREKIFDGGDYFTIIDDQEQESYVVQAKQQIKANSNIFLIDHSISFKYGELGTVVTEQVLDRLDSMIKYQLTKKQLTKQEKQYWRTEDFDNSQFTDPSQTPVLDETQSITFIGNQIESIELCLKFLQSHPNIKALWLDDNPLDFDQLLEQVEAHCPWVEILNGKFTVNASVWGFKYVSFDFDIKKANYTEGVSINQLNLSNRQVLRVRSLSEIYNAFPNLKKIIIKDTEIKSFEDTNQFFRIISQIEYIECDLEVEEILHDLFLNGKLDKVAPKLLLVNDRDIRYPSYVKTTQAQQRLQIVKQNILKIAGSYRLLSSDQMDEQSIWYVLDELGTSIQHSDTPNVKVLPFLYLPSGKIDETTISYSILFPIQHLQANQPIYRDYLTGITEEKFRSYRLGVWYDIPYDFMIEGYQKYYQNLTAIKNSIQPFEQQQGEIEYLPKENIKVITDLEMVSANVNLPYIQFTHNLEEADIIYFGVGVHDDINQYLGKFINQYQHEYAIISKEKLAFTIQSAYGIVDWLQETFNLQNQLPLFMGCYKQRELENKENTWIIKPPNMARSMDMVVTNNLDVILRVLETGPKLAQKYIDKPLTIRKKKFDLRFIVALRSIEPLSVYIYSTFWIRISNNPFTMDVNTFTTYETHFTVMNYGRQLTQVFMKDFIQEFNQEYYPYTWDQQYEKIKLVVKELFIALKKHKPEMAECKKNRSVYGMDLMIDQNFTPKLLEMTFSPDCTRACKYTPSFFNDLFETLFFGVENQNMIKII